MGHDGRLNVMFFFWHYLQLWSEEDGLLWLVLAISQSDSEKLRLFRIGVIVLPVTVAIRDGGGNWVALSSASANEGDGAQFSFDKMPSTASEK